MVPSSPSEVEARYGELYKQIKALYGRTAYSHKTHEKQADQLHALGKRITWINLVVSGITTTSLLLAIFGDSRPATIIGGVFAAIQFILSAHLKDTDYNKLSTNHAKTAHNLWVSREQLMSLITDMRDQRLTPDEVIERRERAQADLQRTYADAPRTNAKAYAAAQKALQKDQELFFGEQELEDLIQ